MWNVNDGCMPIYWDNSDMMSKWHWTVYFARGTLLHLSGMPSPPPRDSPVSSPWSLPTSPLGLGVGGTCLRRLLLCASRANSVYLYLALILWDCHFLPSLSPHPSRLELFSTGSLVPHKGPETRKANSACLLNESVKTSVTKKIERLLEEGQRD